MVARSEITGAASPGTASASASASLEAGTPSSPRIFSSTAEITAAESPSPASSERTPSHPILSSLSSTMKKASHDASGTPLSAASAARNRRSDSLIVVPSSPMAASARLVASISSASASTLGSPIMSMSHW